VRELVSTLVHILQQRSDRREFLLAEMMRSPIPLNKFPSSYQL